MCSSDLVKRARTCDWVYLWQNSTHFFTPEGWGLVTLVIPSTPMLGLEEVDPLPVPSSPAMMQHTPSVKIPLQQQQITYITMTQCDTKKYDHKIDHTTN